MQSKILIVYNVQNEDNLFVPLLYRTLQQLNPNIRCSQKEFWFTKEKTDIIHFHWPEEVIDWNCPETNTKILQQLVDRITYFKSQGCKFIYTCHNLSPHHGNSIVSKAYRLIEENSDCIVHMGNYSYNILSQKYPEKIHMIIPHHIYENSYNKHISQAEARRKLKIPINKTVITAFGSFRNIDEMSMVLKAYLKSNLRHKYLLAPRLYPFSKHPKKKPLKQIMAWIFYQMLIPVFNRFFNIQGGENDQIISNDLLPYYLIASDVVFIQRNKILNSGNIPLAFLFQKVVIGPDCGNAGELLRKTGNPVFNPNAISSITAALQNAITLNLQHQGEANYQYALKHFNLEITANQYITIYHILQNSPNINQ